LTNSGSGFTRLVRFATVIVTPRCWQSPAK
jgi:hypothetical protein